jgi:hypothetical protein
LLAALLALLPLHAFAEAALAIVVADETALRSAPRDSAKAHALLWQGEALEVRGERLDHLQVYDHRLERGGFVSARSVRRLSLDAASAGEILAVIRFLRETPGYEALGIGYAAAYLRAAPASALRGADGAEVFDALGTFAERLARRASAASSKVSQAILTGHLEVAQRYGVAFASHEREGRITICYDGDASRRLMESPAANAEQKARAVLVLTRLECRPGDLQPTQRRAADEEGVRLLDRAEAETLPGYLRNRVHMRRATLWASLAYQRTRRGENPQSAAGLALQALAAVDRQELTDEDARFYSEAVMRVNASRWAVVTPMPPAKESGERPHVVLSAGPAGETCVALVNAKREASNPLARRCTFGIVWEGSATLNREGNALALAVQHTEAWREMWIFRRAGAEWTVRVVPPAPVSPGMGYAEFAGWVPGGKQMLVAREATGDGKYNRSYELVRLDSLASIAKAPEPDQLPAFGRWQDPSWTRSTVSVR